ncbi:MAG: HAD family hydrolase [Chloroflexi bacterium]|nr:HAD family hydrolase [Chloroflexota bacterium]
MASRWLRTTTRTRAQRNVNGTIAKDGRLLDKVAKQIALLRDRLQVHMITADTYGKQDNIDLMLGAKSLRLKAGNEAEQKGEYVRGLGAEKVVAIGNGANDAEMLKAAAIGIAVVGDEGLAVEALLAANVVMHSIHEALNLLEFPTRLAATLRK